MGADPFLIPITALRRNPGTRHDEVRRGVLGSLTVAASRLPDDAEVTVDVAIEVAVGGMSVAGTVRGPWEGECRRCLQAVRGELTAEVLELYRPEGQGEDAEDTYILGIDHLDLRPLARDAILLELPLAPLCRPDCAGLCPICGADRNDTPCDCGNEAVDPRWAALDALRPDSH
jgi:uncharacterized protein